MKFKLKYLLLTLGAAQLAFTLNATSGEPYSPKISSGFYQEELPDPIFYDSFIPLIHEYKYPSWTTIDLTLRDWRGMCQTDEFAPSYTCPVFYYLERFIERLQLEIVNQNTRRFAQTAPSSVKNIPDKCNKVQRHFDSLLTSKSSLDDYIQSWGTCPVQGSVFRPAIQDYVYQIKDLYKKMLAKFESEFSARTTGSTDRAGPSYYVNHITASQGIMMLNYWVEHSRWESAARSCALQQIPTTLIKPANLTSGLSQIETEAQKQKYSVSIPVNETGSYLILPLTDCTFTDDSTFAVRILVPVKRKPSTLKLVKLQPIPFLLNDNAETYSICQIFDAQGIFVYDNVSGYLVQSNCKPGQLCQIENPARVPIPNLCASAYFHGQTWDIKKYCNFQCEKVIDNVYPRLPIFRQVTADTFIVTGNSNIEVVIKCEGKRDQLVNPEELGSLEIQLPCDCSLNFRSQVYLPEQPCFDQLNIKSLMPLQFFNTAFINGEKNQSFTGVLEKGMMEPKYFAQAEGTQGERNGKAERAERMIGANDDVEDDAQVTRNNVHAAGDDRNTSNNGSSGTVAIWIVLVLQGLIIVAFIVYFVKRDGFHRLKNDWSEPRRMSFSNPLAVSDQDN